MNKETKLLQDLERYKEMESYDKFMTRIDLEEQKIPADQIDMESEKVLDAIKRTLLAEFNGEVDGEAVGEIMNAYNEPKIRMTGNTQIELNVGEDTLILTNYQLKQLINLLNGLSGLDLTKTINSDDWTTINNLKK